MLKDRIRIRFRSLLQQLHLPIGLQWPRSPTLLICSGLVIMAIIGTLLLLLPGVGRGRQLGFAEAAFTAASALSVTGLSVIVPQRDLSTFGQIILLILIQIGGVGFMVLAVVLFQMLGRHVSMVFRLALSESFGLPTPGAILALLRNVLIGVIVIESIGALLLWWHWEPILGNERALYYAIFHSISAFCSAGFELFTGLPEFPNGMPNDEITMAIISLMILLGGLGIPVISDLIRWPWQRRLSLHSRLTLVTIFSLIFIGWFGLWLVEARGDGVIAQEPIGRQLSLSLFQAISARSAGFTGLPSFEFLSPASQFLLMNLMFIGSAPAAMGGGITTGTLVVLLLALVSYLRGSSNLQVSGRSIGLYLVQRAIAVLLISLLVVTVATWLILFSHDVSLETALFEVISAFATCGLSLAFTDDLNGFGKLVIIAVMLWGRLGALTIMIGFATRQIKAELIEYPEESILIG
jgi:trk system potassium uptake protein TrkH